MEVEMRKPTSAKGGLLKRMRKLRERDVSVPTEHLGKKPKPELKRNGFGRLISENDNAYSFPKKRDNLG